MTTPLAIVWLASHVSREYLILYLWFGAVPQTLSGVHAFSIPRMNSHRQWHIPRVSFGDIEFNSDYMFTRLGICRTCCRVLWGTVHGNFWVKIPLYPLRYTPLFVRHMCIVDVKTSPVDIWGELTKRWDSERELFLRPRRTILQNIIRCWIFNTTQAVTPRVGVASWY